VLDVPNAQQANAGNYSVVITNPAGTIVSAEATLSFVFTTVYAWGFDGFGETEVPPDLTNVVAIAASSDASFALNSDGTVVTWGEYGSGQTGLTNVMAIAASDVELFALLQNGTIVTWGASAGYSTYIPPCVSNVVAIAAADDYGSFNDFCLALKADGTVVAFGANSEGQTDVPPCLMNVVAVAAGEGFSVALKADHRVVVWGGNPYGVTNVPCDLTNVVAIGAGPSAWFCLAVKADGTVDNWEGLQLPADWTNVVAVSMSQILVMALRADHTVAAWGDDSYGEYNIPPGLTNVIDVAAGYGHAVVLDPSGGVISISASSAEFVGRGIGFGQAA